MEAVLEGLLASFEDGEWEAAAGLISANQLDQATLSQLLIQAADFQAPETVFTVLLEAGADVNAEDEEEGGGVNAQNSYGETPLHLAIQMEDSFEVIQLLLKHGANVNLGNELGETPFHFAANKPLSCTLQVAKLLLDHKGDLGLKTLEGEDVVDIARRKRVDSEVFELLYEAY
ncbi:hypothetical protein BASA81_006696 [Batrachochytrium salamandrivorans]|nr:hypothetical protein BASA81_006696 [Batrachochytrium salamandrivorans]